MYNIEDFAMLTPMKYYDNPDPATAGAIQKRLDMINNKDNKYMATVKNDGDWSMLIHYSKGNNLIRSRSISKVTGVYGDYTTKLPHICTEMDKLPDNTVLLAEICWDEPGTNANTVGTILRCLPEKAVERQREHKLKALVFDALMINNEDMTSYPYEARFSNASYTLEDLISPSEFLYMTQLCELDENHENFLEWADEIIENGGEGLVIQLKDNPYMPGTRTAWKTLKLKQRLPEMELKVLATLEPKKLYEGDMPDSWQYKDEDGTLVTKPYFYGWKNGVVVDYNGVETSVASGLTDADREWLASDDAQKMIANGELYAVVRGMSTNDLGAIRHPVLVRLRNDL